MFPIQQPLLNGYINDLFLFLQRFLSTQRVLNEY